MHYLFIEVPNFMKRRDRYFESDDEFRAFQTDLAVDPKVWGAMPGCGGLRKARWGDTRRHKGKRGGIRVIYLALPVPSDEPRGLVFLVHVYDKDEKDDLTPDERRILKRLADNLTREVRGHEERWL